MLRVLVEILYHVWLSYCSALFSGKLVLQKQKRKEGGRCAVIQVKDTWTDISQIN